MAAQGSEHDNPSFTQEGEMSGVVGVQESTEIESSSAAGSSNVERLSETGDMGEVPQNPDEAIKVAEAAAKMAREAALSCRKTVVESSSAIKIGRKLLDSFVKKAEVTLESRDADCRSRLQNCRGALKKVLEACDEADEAADEACATADNVDIHVTQLSEVLGMQPEAVSEKQLQLITIANAAKSNAIKAYEKKYLLLKSIIECWRQANSEETDREASRETGRTCNFKVSIPAVSAGILFILGCVLLALPYYVTLNPEAHDLLKVVGIVKIVLSSTFGLFLLLWKVEKVSGRQRRQKKFLKFKEELSALEKFIESIVPVPS